MMSAPAPLRTGRGSMCQSVARSHVGRVRTINEDRAFDCPEHGVWGVADGMGGHAGGDIAAQTIVTAMRTLVAGAARIDADALLGAIHAANAAIIERNNALGSDAGSTIVAAHLAADATATIAWVGDSRAYLVRDGMVRQLTHDHSFVQDLIDAGLLSAEAALRHPRANVVTRALGVRLALDIATVAVALVPGDRLILCSDGLSRSLRDADLLIDAPLERLADTLIANALARDGSDNTTVIVIAPAGL